MKIYVFGETIFSVVKSCGFRDRQTKVPFLTPGFTSCVALRKLTDLFRLWFFLPNKVLYLFCSPKFSCVYVILQLFCLIVYRLQNCLLHISVETNIPFLKSIFDRILSDVICNITRSRSSDFFPKMSIKIKIM